MANVVQQYADNPVLPGFHPDPSVCRVGEDYYLVNSSFEYFPGLPLHHSRDLVHWRPVGHVLDRPGQLPLDGVPASGGLYAPTIRHHDGVYYVVCTLMDGTRESGNFVVTATDPAGPWSDPVWLPEAPGFDPSLFFDQDGSSYLLGTRTVGTDGRTEIWLRPIDRHSWQFTGPDQVLFTGALVDAVWAEGPHLYRHLDHYYLVLAEGGTFRDHAVTVARSSAVTGPYENNPRNPVLTHRHLGRDYPVTSTGHADLVDTPEGDWYALLLACRPYGGDFANLGRETFLARVVWEDGWPVVSPGVGRLEQRVPVTLPAGPWPGPVGELDDFDSPALAPHWTLLRTPRTPPYSLSERRGQLRLRLLPATLDERDAPAFVGRRQQHQDFTASTRLDFEPTAANECAGLALLQNDGHQIRLLVVHDPATGGKALTLTVRSGGKDELRARVPLRSVLPVRLGVRAVGQEYTFLASQRTDGWDELATVDGRLLSSQVAGGFTGALVGMYASGRGRASDTPADFDWFRYSAGPGADPAAEERSSAG